MKKVLITGLTGTLGNALARQYTRDGWHVTGVSRKADVDSEGVCQKVIQNNQTTEEDAIALLNENPDLLFLCAGAIENEIEDNGLPIQKKIEEINTINYDFPCKVVLSAAAKKLSKPLDVIAIGSIADGSPSCFGPVYHASKAAMHYFFTGVGPIAKSANENLRVRVYRPGVIYGPLSWAPVNRLNQRSYKLRAKRCNKAPEAEFVARKIKKWAEKGSWVGSDREPVSFKFLKFLYGQFPDLYYRLQLMGWKMGSKY